MPQNEAASIDPLAGGSFSRLLFSDVGVEDAVNILGLDDHHRCHYPDNTNGGGASHFAFSSDRKPPKMLCFGSDYISSNINGVSGVSSTPQNSTTTTADDNYNSSSPSSTTTTTTTTTSFSSTSNMKRNMRCNYYQPIELPSSVATTAATTAPARNCKKMRAEKTPPASHAKVKKEKLGERIAALQQIVSPYGKTDTASVLHEAMGYIKFLQDQVQVLCSPYLQRPPSIHIEGKEEGEERMRKDLRSRGLCLVPVECTLQVAESNGADLWSPAAMVNRHNSAVLN